jgi:hypothetical protein
MATLYVNKPGGAILHESTGESVVYHYGQEVDLDKIRESARKYLPRVTSTTRPPDAPEPPVNTDLETAMIEAGQQHSSASAIPGNYHSLTEDQAVRLIQSIENKNDQATLVAYEKQNENRLRVIDAASNDAKDQAEVLLAIEGYEAGKAAEAVEDEAPAKDEAPAEEVVEKAKSTPKPKKTAKK